MIRWFLCQFAQFRKAEADLAEASADLLKVRDAFDQESASRLRCEELLLVKQGEIDRIWEAFRAKDAQAERSYQTLVNFGMQRGFGVTVYPDAPQLPKHHMPPEHVDEPGGPVESGVVQGSTLVSRRTREFLNQAYERAGLARESE